MSFIYYVPGTDNNSVDIKALGLACAFDRGPSKGMNHKGFDGETSGALLMERESMPSARLTLQPDEQVWKKLKNYYVGYWKDLVPTEESLRRRTRLAGSNVTLGNEAWQVPVAISFEEYNGDVVTASQLSRYVDCDEDGQPVLGQVEEQFAPLLDEATRWLEASSDPDFEYTQADLFCSAARVMSFNYRMCLPEMAILQLLTNGTAVEIMDACIDKPTLDMLLSQKKTTPTTADETTTSDGEPVEQQDSSQQRQTSS